MSEKELPTMTDERFLELAAEEEAMSDNYRKQLTEATMSEKEKELPPNLWIDEGWIDRGHGHGHYSYAISTEPNAAELYIPARKIRALIDSDLPFDDTVFAIEKLIDEGK